MVMAPALSPASLAVTVTVNASPATSVPVVGLKETPEIVGIFASRAGVEPLVGDVT